MSKNKKQRPYGVTSGGEKLAYAFGDLGSNFVWTFVSSFLTLYYTDSVLLATAAVGTMMLIIRLFDGVSDIIVGALIEKTSTKMGKARPWFAFSIIPLAVAEVLTFSTPASLSSGAKWVYVTITYFLLTVVVYTINNLAYHSMLSRFSLDSADRNKVSSLRGIFSFIAGLALAILTPRLLAAQGGEKDAHSWLVVASIYAILCVIFQGICCFVCKEKISCEDDAKERSGEPVDLKVGVKRLFKLKYFYLSVFAFIATFIINGLSTASAVYFARDVLGSENYYSLMVIGGILATIFGISISPKLFQKSGKQKVLMAAAIISAIGCVVGIIGGKAASFPIVLAAKLLTGLGVAPFVAAIFTFASDIVEYLELKTGVRYEGLATSVNSVGTKIGTGLASAFVGWGLHIGHYDATLAVQPASALTAETVLLFGIPLVCNIINLILMKFWDMDSRLAELRAAKQ